MISPKGRHFLAGDKRRQVSNTRRGGRRRVSGIVTGKPRGGFVQKTTPTAQRFHPQLNSPPLFFLDQERGWLLTSFVHIDN